MHDARKVNRLIARGHCILIDHSANLSYLNPRFSCMHDAFSEITVLLQVTGCCVADDVMGARLMSGTFVQIFISLLFHS